MLLSLWLACTINPDGPATAGSPSAEHAAAARALSERAAEIEALATQLESEIDEGRRRVAAGTSTQEQEIARVRSLMAQIEEKNTALQAELTAWEQQVPRPGGGQKVP